MIASFGRRQDCNSPFLAVVHIIMKHILAGVHNITRRMAHYNVDAGEKVPQKLGYNYISLGVLKVMEYSYYCFPSL